MSTGVLRWRRDVGATSALGVLYAGRDGDDYSNQVYGVDGSRTLCFVSRESARRAAGAE